MPLETGTTINNLDPLNPVDGINDDASEGWAHINLIKDVMKKQFPGAGTAGFNRALLVNEDELNYLAGVISPLQAQIDALQGSVMEAGDIIMFHGAIGTLPANFSLCNGLNGTPDLTDMFIMGAATDGEIGSIGGNNDSAIISHNHNTGHSHSFSTSVDGAHDHFLSNGGSGSGGTNVLMGENNFAGASTKSVYTEDDVRHDHPVSMSTNATSIDTVGGAIAGNNMPPFYKLAYIQRTS